MLNEKTGEMEMFQTMGDEEAVLRTAKRLEAEVNHPAGLKLGRLIERAQSEWRM